MERVKEIKVYMKSEFETWDEAIERVFHGKEIKRTENRDLYEFVEDLLMRTHYSEFALTRIYKTIEEGYLCVLYRQTQNEYGGYVGSISLYATIDDIVKNIKRC